MQTDLDKDISKLELASATILEKHTQFMYQTKFWFQKSFQSFYSCSRAKSWYHDLMNTDFLSMRYIELGYCPVVEEEQKQIGEHQGTGISNSRDGFHESMDLTKQVVVIDFPTLYLEVGEKAKSISVENIKNLPSTFTTCHVKYWTTCIDV